MQEATETFVAPPTPSTVKSAEMANPFSNATPLPMEYFTTHTPAGTGKVETATPPQEYRQPSQQEQELMKVIANAAGGDTQMLEAMKQAASMEAASNVSGEMPVNAPVNAEPKSLLYKIGKGAYGVVVFIARLLGIKPINSN